MIVYSFERLIIKIVVHTNNTDILSNVRNQSIDYSAQGRNFSLNYSLTANTSTMAQNSYEHSWFKVKRNISEPIKTMVDNFENKMEKKLRRI